MTARDDRLRELAQAATPGTWMLDPDEDEGTSEVIVEEYECHAIARIACDFGTDAAYIAAASPDVVLGLLDRLAAVEAERDRLAAAVERVEALADEWTARDDLTQWGDHCESRHAHAVRAVLSDAGRGK